MLLRSFYSALFVSFGWACLASGAEPSTAAPSMVPPVAQLPVAMLKTYCNDCHSGAEAEGGFDLATLKTDLADGETFRRWVKIHDRMASREMPPADAPQPPDAERGKVVKQLQTELAALERARIERDGRTPIRRMTRAEYENTIRDVLALEGIPLHASLPEDGSAHGFDKNSDALDISHVNLAKYVEAADAALDMAIATQPEPPLRQTHRFSLGRHIYHITMNGDAVTLKDGKPDPAFPPGGHIAHLGPVEHINVCRDNLERGASVGVFRHEDESFKPYFYDFAALYPGRYRIKTSFWAFQWDKGKVLPARGTEAARLSVVQLQDDGRGGGHPSYILGYYDAPPDKPQVHELTTWLNPKDTIGFNTASLAPVVNYSRPGRAMAFTGPGIACDFFEIEGPIHEAWPPESHRRLFGDLPLASYDPKSAAGLKMPRRKLLRQETQAPNRPDPTTGNWTVVSLWPEADADRLLASFLPRAFRKPVSDELRKQYVDLVKERLAAGECFENAMRYAYRAALTSPDFLYHVENSAGFDDHALASRLSYFLWNSAPDDGLVQAADAGKVRTPKTVREEVERMLKDPKAQRFIDDFLGQWLNLRKIAANDPDRKLYPEFSAYLQDSMVAETRAYFREMLEKDLDARHLVRSDFAMLNEKLAALYDVPGVTGSQIRRVPLPKGCPRGAFLTQAAVMKVTANGTTTSPVPRGAFVMAKFLGKPPEPPPPNIPAVEPDVQGATTIREQLDKHRSITVCASCHKNIDPPGFALESFDVIGGLRDRYRSIGSGDPAVRGKIDPFIGISFLLGPKVDPSGALPDGRTFKNIEEFQMLLTADPRPLLKNLAEQLTVYATGRPIGFGDRAEMNGIVDRTLKKGGGLRTLIHEITTSKLFLPVGLTSVPPAKPNAYVPTAATPTRRTPPNLPQGMSVAAHYELKPGAPAPNSLGAAPAGSVKLTLTSRLQGLHGDERKADLKRALAEMPEVQMEKLDAERQEVTLACDMTRLYPQSALNHKPTEEQLRQQVDNTLRRVSHGSFTLKPISAVPGDKLVRHEVAVTLQDCPPCRTFAYNTAAKVDGVEKAAFDAKANKLVVWMDPAKGDLKPVLEALEKAKIEMPAAKTNDNKAAEK
jgi:hypothetical protein